MPVSGNEETAIKPHGGKSSLHVAGVPMKKRRFIWPSSPTPEERSLSQVEEDVAVKKSSPSRESVGAVSSLGLSDSNKSSALEENKKGSETIVPTNININNPSFRIQEAGLANQFDSLGKSDDNEKLAVAEKSANILTGIKQPLGGVPMKKRKFVRPSSPPHENPSCMLVGNDAIKKQHDTLSLETAPSSASIGGSSSGLSDVNKKDAPEKNRTSDNMVQTSVVYHSRVKIEEACPVAHSDSLVLDKKKLQTSEKCANFVVKSADTELNLAPSKTPAGNEQIAEGKSKVKSIGSGNHELSLGLTGSQLSAPEDQSHDSSWKQGNIESFSLNLSSSSGERNSQFKMDQVQSNSGSGNLLTDRSNWDLNTTMDAWEASAHDGAAGEVVPEGSNIVDSRNDAKPLMLIGVASTSVATEKQLFNESEYKTNLTRTLPETSQQYSSEDSLHLRLSPYFPLFSHESSDLSANKGSCSAIPNISSPKEMLSGSQTVNSRTIKSEPVEVSAKNGSSGSEANSMLLLGFRAVPVKSEYVEKLAQEASKLPNSSPRQSLKSEPIRGDNLETLKTTTEGMPQQSDKEVQQSQDARGKSTSSTSEHVLQGQDIQGQATCLTNELMVQVQNTTGQSNCSTNEDVLQGQVSGGQSNYSTDEQILQGPNSITKPTCSIGLSVNGNGLDYLVDGALAGADVSNEAPKRSCESAEEDASEMGSLPVGHTGDGINGSSGIGAMITEEKSADISDQLKQKSKDQLPPDPHQSGECTVSDEEKINLSGDILEEDSYSSEFESDGNSMPMEIEEDGRGQDEYEDGEVRVPQPHDAVEGPICEKTEDASHVDSEDKKAIAEEVHGKLHPSSSDVESKNIIKEQLVDAKEDAVVDADATLIRKTIDAEQDASLEESSKVEISNIAVDERNLVRTIQINLLNLSANEDKVLGSEQSSDQPVSEGHGTFIDAAQATNENFKTSDVEKDDLKDDSALLKVDTSVNVDDAAKDANSGGNQSRIINLSIASNMSSFGKARTISGNPLPLRPGRDRLPDMPLEGERLHLRGREEAYTEGSHKFARERYQDQSSRNSRWNFGHGRGRFGSRIDSMRNDRDPERDYVPRHKYTPAVTGSDTEYMNYNMGQDGAFVNNGRGGRKVLDDDTTLFRQLSSRRRSPGTRDGPASRGIQMVRRVPRNMGEDNSEVVGMRHAEKIMRGFPDDGEEQHAYTRPQPPFEGLDGRFVQGTRNFSNVQRRGMPQMRSKSPIRSRSPGQWSSRRRSPDGFGGPPELPRRSPIYRMERIRSPNNSGFPTDRVPRRHGSPSYMTRPNELRDIDPGRDHGHPRSIISNRNPNGRVLLRNNRRFNVVDPRERAENDEFFGGPVPSGRFHELGGDGNGEERRRFDERRAHVRPFRPPFNGAEGENFHVNTEDGPRSFRYFPEDNPEFHEQRPREFDRRIKTRPGNGPRRPRNIEEQEGNYRHGGQVMYDDGFDDMSRVKRKRF